MSFENRLILKMTSLGFGAGCGFGIGWGFGGSPIGLAGLGAGFIEDSWSSCF